MTDRERLNEVQGIFCYSCQKRLTEIVKLSGKKTLTQTFSKICQNPDCVLFINLEKVKTWKEKNYDHQSRDFQRQNRPEYNQNLARGSNHLKTIKIA